MKRIACIVGTRPDAIKMAPVIRALQSRPEKFDVLTWATSQHREMLEQVRQNFGLTWDRNLDIMMANQTLETITTRGLTGLSQAIREDKPDLVIVQGDTTTSFVGALAAYYEKVPVGHVEAGLRTYNKYQPFPEEMNRCLIDQIAALLWPPTQGSYDALALEHLVNPWTSITGNTAIDALLQSLDPEYIFTTSELKALTHLEGRILLVTAHRRESFGPAFVEFAKTLVEMVDHYTDLQIVYPVHPNPNVRSPIEECCGAHPRIHLIAPVEYRDFIHLARRSWMVMTDSGGVQEEVPSLGKPVLVLRDVTERMEGVEAGTARLVGMHREKILAAFGELYHNQLAYQRMATAKNPYGDGLAGERIAEMCARYLYA